MTLQDRIAEIDPIEGRRFARMFGKAREIAAAGIIRHLDACDRNGVEPDHLALREIMEDAWQGRAVYKENVP